MMPRSRASERRRPANDSGITVHLSSHGSLKNFSRMGRNAADELPVAPDKLSVGPDELSVGGKSFEEVKNGHLRIRLENICRY
jgi:hypothetical protein